MALCKKTKKGLTLIEAMIAVAMLVILTGAITYAFRAVLLSWSSQETRTGINVNLKYDIEDIVRELRGSRQAGAVNNDEVRFSQDKVTYYVYYLYNPSDGYPPAFGQSAYQLKKAALTGGLNGTFAYGSGDLIMSDIKPRTAFTPARPVISFTDNMVTMDISIARGDETVRSRTAVRPRNL